ncbi:hypothetical protein [Spiroplasma endosymbiont of Sarcophaga variegata]|uniref:hypothetical protein n=1 Tax=Spiroplasma endosymbiont of Sarcophaga variegata TaxID=3066304 RepID=UPI003AF8064F
MIKWNGLNNFQVPKSLFTLFSNADNARIIPDFSLFSFKQEAGWYNSNWDYNGSDKINANGGGYDGTFIFGKARFHYTPFYHYGDKTSTLILSKTLDEIKKIINMTIWKLILCKIMILL